MSRNRFVNSITCVIAASTLWINVGFADTPNEVTENRPRYNKLYRALVSDCFKDFEPPVNFTEPNNGTAIERAEKLFKEFETVDGTIFKFKRIGAPPVTTTAKISVIAECVVVANAVAEALGQFGEIRSFQSNELLTQVKLLTDEVAKLRARVELDLFNVLNKK